MKSSASLGSFSGVFDQVSSMPPGPNSDVESQVSVDPGNEEPLVGNVSRYVAISENVKKLKEKGAPGTTKKLSTQEKSATVKKVKKKLNGKTTEGASNEENSRPKKGNLIFDANFESGNLGRVDSISGAEYDLFVRPDTCNPKYRLWYYFTVENNRAGQRVIFNIVNFSKVRSLYQDGMAPVVQTSFRDKWQRIPSRHVFYSRSANHENRFVMSFAFCFDNEDEVYKFAYCYPYTYSDLQDYLSMLDSKQLAFYHRDLLGETVQKRRLDLLTISDPENYSVSNKQKIIFITARVHPGESPASYICHGLIEFLLSPDPSAVKLRKEFVFKIVPMLNPDGVYLGNYRCSLMGFDLNRHWQVPSSWAHPTVHATKNLLLQYNKNSQMKLIAYLDIHAHSTRMNSFFYGNVFTKDKARCEKQLILPALVAELSEDFSLDHTQFNTDSTKQGTSRRTLGYSLDVNCLCYTLEVSFFGYNNNKLSSFSPAEPYTADSYSKIGENICRALLQYSEIENGSRIPPKLSRSFQSFVKKSDRDSSSKNTEKSGRNSKQSDSTDNNRVIPRKSKSPSKKGR